MSMTNSTCLFVIFVCCFHLIICQRSRKNESVCKFNRWPDHLNSVDGFLELKCHRLNIKCDKSKSLPTCDFTWRSRCPPLHYVSGVRAYFIGRRKRLNYKVRCCTHHLLKSEYYKGEYSRSLDAGQEFNAVGQNKPGEMIEYLSNIFSTVTRDNQRIKIGRIQCEQTTTTTTTTRTTKKPENKNKNDENIPGGGGGGPAPCFVENGLVETEEGLKRVVEVSTGEVEAGCNEFRALSLMMNLNETFLNVVVFENGHWLKDCAIHSSLKATTDCTNPGLSAEIFLSILTYLNLPYKLIPYKTPSVGQFRNDSWHNGMFAQLQNGQIDLITSLIINTELKRRKFAFSYPIDNLEIAFLIAQGHTDTTASFWLLSKPFTVKIWLILMFCVSIFGLLVAGFYASSKTKGTFFNFVNKSHLAGIRFTWIIFMFAILFFSQLYAGILLTYLLKIPTTKLVKDLNHLVDLISKGRLTLLAWREDRGFYQPVKYSAHPFFNKMRKTLDKNPIVFESREKEFKKLFSTGKFVVMTYGTLGINFYKRNWCRLQVLGSVGLPLMELGIMVKKGSDLEQKINVAILNRHGRIEAILNRYKGRHIQLAFDHCTRQMNPDHGRKALKLRGLSGGLILFTVCSIVGCISFIIEYLGACRRQDGGRAIRKKLQERAKDDKNEKISDGDEETQSVEGSSKSTTTILHGNFQNWECELQQDVTEMADMKPKEEFVICCPYGIRLRMKPINEDDQEIA